MFTRFMDMHSGGGCKEKPYEYIYIEAPQEEAKLIFYNKFGHNPDRVTCTCCGEDYSINQEKTLELASAYDRQCDWDKNIKNYNLDSAKISIEDYVDQEDVLVIYEKDIKEDERTGNIPEQGYIWVD